MIEQATLFTPAFDTGQSTTNRLHHLFVSIEEMTAAEHQKGGANLKINYSLAESHFGSVLVASTSKGICYMAFEDEHRNALNKLRKLFPNATYEYSLDVTHQNALLMLRKDWSSLNKVKLHLKGTAFQLKVWEALMKIPVGSLTTYGKLAGTIGAPKASRAVGSAIGSNPIAYLIPCHRVIQVTGRIGGYAWGAARKTALIGWEAALSHTD